MTDVLNGIDVSAAQGQINWTTLAASKQVDFVITKATEGPLFVDQQFVANWAGIKAGGLIRGAYHFAHTQNDPAAEANHFVNTLTGLTAEDMLVLDIEVSNINGSTFTHWVLTWLETVEQKTGIIPFVYTGGPFFNQHSVNADADTVAKLQKYPLWLAAYTTSPDSFVPNIWKTKGWTFWQRSGDVAAAGDTVLHVPGIRTVVDHNQFRGTADELKQLILNLHTGQDNSFSTMITDIENSIVPPNIV